MSTQRQVLRNNPFDGVFAVDNTRKTKLSDIQRRSCYNDIINRIGWSRYKWTIPEYTPNGLKTTLTSAEIERAVCCGAGVVYQVPASIGSASSGMWVCTPVEWVGVMKADNTADDFITYLPYGDYSITKRQLNGKYVIIKNNFEMSSEYAFTEWYADMLTETDISEMQLIKFARMIPIAKVLDDASAAQIENVLKRVYDGEPWLTVKDSKKLITQQPTTRDDDILRLTDETAIEKMHFLSEFHYELIRRLCNVYNIPFHTTAKSAQNLESELHNTDIFSRMITDDGLDWRKRSIDDLSNLLDGECNVEIGDLFKLENKVIENIADATKPDDPASDITDEPTDEQSDNEGDSNE